MTQPALQLEDILKVLPHRYPMLLVDRVLDLEVGHQIRAIKNVTFNEGFFQGHFPGRPVMPGVLIIEAMAQVGGILAYFTDPNMKGKLIYFMAMDKVKFRRPVVPGDQLILEVKDLHRSSRAWKMEGKGLVDGKVVAQAEVTAAW
jgi:3-hydroxyacyl-[acyl-carrier-protein] dehydratase